MRYATFACVVESHLIYPTQLLSHNVLLLGLAMSKALILILFVVRRAIFRYPFHAGAMRVKWRGAKPKRRRWMMVARVSRLMGLGIDQDQTNRRENYASHTLKQRFTIKVIFNETLVISSYINYSQNLPKFGRPLKMSCNPGKRAWMNLSFDLKCPVTFHQTSEIRRRFQHHDIEPE